MRPRIRPRRAARGGGHLRGHLHRQLRGSGGALLYITLLPSAVHGDAGEMESRCTSGRFPIMDKGCPLSKKLMNCAQSEALELWGYFDPQRTLKPRLRRRRPRVQTGPSDHPADLRSRRRTQKAPRPPGEEPHFRTQHSALSTQHSALSTQHSALSTQHSALSTQHSALSTQHSALSTQHSALSTQDILRVRGGISESPFHADHRQHRQRAHRLAPSSPGR